MHQQDERPAAAPQTKLSPQLVHRLCSGFSGGLDMTRSILSQQAFGDPALEKTGGRLCRFRHTGLSAINVQQSAKLADSGQGAQGRCFAGVGRSPAAIERPVARSAAHVAIVAVPRWRLRLSALSAFQIGSTRHARSINCKEGRGLNRLCRGQSCSGNAARSSRVRSGSICSIERRTHCPVHPRQVEQRGVWQAPWRSVEKLHQPVAEPANRTEMRWMFVDIRARQKIKSVIAERPLQNREIVAQGRRQTGTVSLQVNADTTRQQCSLRSKQIRGEIFQQNGFWKRCCNSARVLMRPVRSGCVVPSVRA
jgi:hypothetical protein